MEKVKIWYLGHSGVCLKTKAETLIFDYYGTADNKNGLDSGKINFNELSDENVYVFASHSHGDHYSRSLHKEGQNFDNVKFILGEIKSAQNNTYIISRHTSLTIDHMEVTAAASRDSGTCLSVNTPGVKLFHSGDNANWEGGDLSVSFFDEIDFIAKNTSDFDIIFIPVCDFDGYMYDSIIEGAFYTIKKLRPRYVFPLHANGREHLYKKFGAMLEKQNFNVKYLCPEKIGEVFTIQ